MKTIYNSTVIEVGSQVELFLQEKMMILFNDSAPSDLRDVSIVHERCSLEDDIKIGDELVIDNHSFKVTFVGDKANETMRELGHSTVTFNGSSEAEMPGMICVEEKDIPTISTSTQLLFRKLS